MCRIKPSKDDIKKTDSKEELAIVLEALIKEERESIWKELKDDEWQLPTNKE